MMPSALTGVLARESIQKRRLILPDPRQRPPRHRLFDRLLHLLDTRLDLARLEDDMYMFRHDHVGDDRNVMVAPCRVKRLGQPEPCPIPIEQW